MHYYCLRDNEQFEMKHKSNDRNFVNIERCNHYLICHLTGSYKLYVKQNCPEYCIRKQAAAVLPCQTSLALNRPSAHHIFTNAVTHKPSFYSWRNGEIGQPICFLCLSYDCECDDFIQINVICVPRCMMLF